MFSEFEEDLLKVIKYFGRGSLREGGTAQIKNFKWEGSTCDSMEMDLKTINLM